MPTVERAPVVCWKMLRSGERKSTRQKGYRLVRHKPYRNWLLHRAVADIMVRQWNPFGWESLPSWIEVHHIDGDRGHCEPGNLILMEAGFHEAISTNRSMRCPYTGRWLTRAEAESMGLVGSSRSSSSGVVEDEDNEVPF